MCILEMEAGQPVGSAASKYAVCRAMLSCWRLCGTQLTCAAHMHRCHARYHLQSGQYEDLAKYLLMVRKKVKDPKVTPVPQIPETDDVCNGMNVMPMCWRFSDSHHPRRTPLGLIPKPLDHGLETRSPVSHVV